MPSLFLLTSLALIVLVLVPGLKQRLRESAFLSRGSETLVVSGAVSKHQRDRKGKDFTKPAEGVIIEVGGFRATTDKGGNYELRFSTRAREHIPVVLRWDRSDRVERIAFPCGEYRLKKDFTIE